MDVNILIKRMEKEGLTVEKDFTGKYTIIGEKYVCTFYKNFGDSTNTCSVNLIAKEDLNKSCNSHYAGFFVDSIKEAVKYLKQV